MVGLRFSGCLKRLFRDVVYRRFQCCRFIRRSIFAAADGLPINKIAFERVFISQSVYFSVIRLRLPETISSKHWLALGQTKLPYFMFLKVHTHLLHQGVVQRIALGDFVWRGIFGQVERRQRPVSLIMEFHTFVYFALGNGQEIPLFKIRTYAVFKIFPT